MQSVARLKRSGPNSPSHKPQVARLKRSGDDLKSTTGARKVNIRAKTTKNKRQLMSDEDDSIYEGEPSPAENTVKRNRKTIEKKERLVHQGKTLQESTFSKAVLNREP